MAVSRAELESMDRDELVETIVELSQTVENRRAVMETDIEARKDLEGTVDGLAERVDDLEAENERLRERIDSADGKKEKVAKIVRYADRARDGAPAVKLTAKEISGAAGVSRRYAYDLMDGDAGLPAEYDWMLTPEQMQQYGSLEIDNEERRLGIDFEGVHSSGCPLNKFTTTPGEGGD